MPNFTPAISLWLHRLFAREFLLRHIPEDCDQVIEIGAGWGASLLHLWLGGGPKEAIYTCVEPSSAGRTLMTRLAELSSMQYRVHSANIETFDPSEAAIGQRVFLFSCWGLGGIQNLPEDFFGRLAKGPIISGAHAEPVGWQMTRRSWWRRAKANSINRAAEAYSRNYRRNENFVSLFKQAESAGLIRITELIENHHSAHALDALSLMAWSRMKSE